MNNYKKIVLTVSAIMFLFWGTNSVLADETTDFLDSSVNISFSNSDLASGREVKVFDNSFQMAIPSGTSTALTGSTTLSISTSSVPAVPWNLNQLSPVYHFSFLAYFPDTFSLSLSYTETSTLKEYKQIFLYDEEANSWKPLTSIDNYNEKYLSTDLRLSSGYVAVFSYPTVLISGRASWYKYKGGDYTASPDFPKGSKLRVYNLANGKFVDVVVNDQGPERNLFPDRVVDLDKVAFQKIGATRDGTIAVRVEPLEIKADSSGRTLGLTKNGASAGFSLTSRSAIVLREKDNEIILEKDSNSVLPLASLTKIVAVKTFLDISDNRKHLSDKVSYKLQDEKNNYKYCSPSESPKVKMKEGEKITIKDLIYSSLIASTNNTVETLARVSGLTRNDFIAQMNENVIAWGATSTSFVEPTGLSPKNVTTASDYALIMAVAAKDPIVVSAATTKIYKFKTSLSSRYRYVYTTNDILDLSKYNILAGKTGFLNEAGKCFTVRFKAGNDNYVAVALGASTWADSYREVEDMVQYTIQQAG
jgi:D-alanyl-D-alanine carboxypeptidase